MNQDITDVKIIYPSEVSRKEAMHRFQDLIDGAGQVDPNQHLTIERLFSQLHLDLRLEKIIPDNAFTFELIHQGLAKKASSMELYFIHPNPDHKWSREMSKRLLSLYKSLHTLENPHDWKDDVGARICHGVVKKIEQGLGGIYSTRRLHVLREKLQGKTTEELFSLRACKGIIFLDHPPKLNLITESLLQILGKIIPIHQLLFPGSVRMGTHGALIEDIYPIRTDEEVPDWVPKHQIFLPQKSKNQTVENGSKHRLFAGNQRDAESLLLHLVQKLDRCTILCSNPSDLIKKIGSKLTTVGIQPPEFERSVSEFPIVSALLNFITTGHGPSAWDVNKILRLNYQNSIDLTIFFDEIIHPKDSHLQPRCHPEILLNIAEKAHIRGGKGALERWLYYLGQKSYQHEIDDEKSVKYEETQWWLLCLASILSPFCDDEDAINLQSKFPGCFTGEILPKPQIISHLGHWFQKLETSLLISQFDIDNEKALTSFLASTKEGLKLLRSHNLTPKKEDCVEMIHEIASTTMLRLKKPVDISTRFYAFEDMHIPFDRPVICFGVESENWLLESPTVPWVDDATKIKLGLASLDQPIRCARHQWNHILASSSELIIIDGTIEEGVELAGPVSEWLLRLKSAGSLEQLAKPPSFISKHEWKSDLQDRAWRWVEHDSINWLLFQDQFTQMSDSGYITHLSGRLPRDERQRTGLAAIEGRKSSSRPITLDAISASIEAALVRESIHREPEMNHLSGGEVIPHDKSNLFHNQGFQIVPSTRGILPKGRDAKIWPHSGWQIENKKFLGIDARPIKPIEFGIQSVDARTGRRHQSLRLPKTWSPHLFNQWLICPRKGWYQGGLKVKQQEKVEDEISSRLRGNLVHELMEWLIKKYHSNSNHQVSMGEWIQSQKDDLWNGMLDQSLKLAPWLTSKGANAQYRLQQFFACTEQELEEWLLHDQPIKIGGRIGRMLESESSINGAVPIATEFKLGNVSKDGLRIDMDAHGFLLRGQIDRVDQILNWKGNANAGMVPLDIDLGSEIPAKRLIIIRDLKTSDGSSDKGKDEKHRQLIFAEMQLALYARAWEVLHPGDRVIGVGTSVIGNNVQHWVEYDSEFTQLLENNPVGNLTNFTHEHFRRPDESSSPKSNPFRAWIRERLTTALRIITRAENGTIAPFPGKHCQYCNIKEACMSADLGGSS